MVVLCVTRCWVSETSGIAILVGWWVGWSWLFDSWIVDASITRIRVYDVCGCCSALCVLSVVLLFCLCVSCPWVVIVAGGWVCRFFCRCVVAGFVCCMGFLMACGGRACVCGVCLLCVVEGFVLASW